MTKGVLSEAVYTRVASEAKEAGSATFRGEQRHKEGRGLDPLVDPAGHGLIRRSLPRFVSHENGLELVMGMAMPIETRFDTTGSMGRNVEVAMKVLLRTYNLLTQGKRAVLGRYDPQIANSTFGDVCDSYVLCRSQFEMAEKIVEQLTMMVPEHKGGDEEEDPDYGIFAGAYLTQARIEDYGLKGYDFTVSDAPGRGHLARHTLKRVFGNDLYDRLIDNGHGEIESSGKLPSMDAVVKALLNRAHAFFLQVGDNHSTWKFWSDLYGEKRVVTMPTTEHLPYYQSTIIGLTEGTLTMSTIVEYLKEEGQLSVAEAKRIANAVSKIPLGAQAALPNFSVLPQRGDVFRLKTDLWPIGHPNDEEAPKGASDKKGDSKKGKKKVWL